MHIIFGWYPISYRCVFKKFKYQMGNGWMSIVNCKFSTVALSVCVCVDSEYMALSVFECLHDVVQAHSYSFFFHFVLRTGIGIRKVHTKLKQSLCTSSNVQNEKKIMFDVEYELFCIICSLGFFTGFFSPMPERVSVYKSPYSGRVRYI